MHANSDRTPPVDHQKLWPDHRAQRRQNRWDGYLRGTAELGGGIRQIGQKQAREVIYLNHIISKLISNKLKNIYKAMQRTRSVTFLKQISEQLEQE